MQPQPLGEQNPGRTRVHARVKAAARALLAVSAGGHRSPPVGRPVPPRTGPARPGCGSGAGQGRAGAGQTQVAWPQPSAFFAMVSPLS